MTTRKKLNKLNRRIAKLLGVVDSTTKVDGHWEWATNIQAALQLIERMDDVRVYTAFLSASKPHLPTSKPKWYAIYSYIATERPGCAVLEDTAAEAICRLFVIYMKAKQNDNE